MFLFVHCSDGFTITGCLQFPLFPLFPPLFPKPFISFIFLEISFIFQILWLDVIIKLFFLGWGDFRWLHGSYAIYCCATLRIEVRVNPPLWQPSLVAPWAPFQGVGVGYTSSGYQGTTLLASSNPGTRGCLGKGLSHSKMWYLCRSPVQIFLGFWTLFYCKFFTPKFF